MENNLFTFETCFCKYGSVEYFKCVLKVGIGSFPAGTEVSRIRFVPEGNVLCLYDDTKIKKDYGLPEETVPVGFLL